MRLSAKKVLITGGAGTLGRALTRRLLAENVDTIRIFSRDEGKQIHMADEFKDVRVRYIIGDIRDRERLILAIEDIDILFHVAALKQVPVAEYNPFEAVKTNVLGSQNVIDACMAEELEVAVAISSDKAVSPLNTYGATKLMMEKIFAAANFYKGARKTIFTSVRYGNVMGSRGSVIPLFMNSIEKYGNINITDPKMTRFNITLRESVNLILRALDEAKGADIFVPKLKAYKLGDLAQCLIEIYGKNVMTKYSSIRPGEKMHESLINEGESAFTVESDGIYVILSPDVYEQNRGLYKNVIQPSFDGSYTSDKVPLIDMKTLKELISTEVLDESNPFKPIY
jgi:UDP-N-acetylglucosamine 4,6-dehydratase/UDP-glucose 4-epimerase